MNSQKHEETDFTPAKYKARIDGILYEFVDTEPTGRFLLEKTGKDLNSHFLVYMMPGQEGVVIELDDNVNLRQPGIEEFILVSRVKQFPIYIDEDSFVFTESHPTGGDLLERAKKPACRYALTQVIAHGDDQFIDADEKVDLRQPGIERFTTVLKDDVTVFIEHDGTQHSVPVRRGQVTVAAIKNAAKVPAGFTLYSQKDGPPMPLDDKASVSIEGCETFLTQVNSGGSS